MTTEAMMKPAGSPPQPVLQWTDGLRGIPRHLEWATPLPFLGCKLTAYGGPNGTGEDVVLLVAEWAQYLRDVNGLCAFCHGDPCAESSPPDSLIARERACSPSYAPFETCPCCEGRPT